MPHGADWDSPAYAERVVVERPKATPTVEDQVEMIVWSRDQTLRSRDRYEFAGASCDFKRYKMPVGKVIGDGVRLARGGDNEVAVGRFGAAANALLRSVRKPVSYTHLRA